MNVFLETPHPHILGQLYQLLGHSARMYATAVVLSVLINTEKPILLFVNIFKASVATINGQLQYKVWNVGDDVFVREIIS